MAKVKSAKALIAAVLSDVDDDAALLVYADWLQDQSDPRGALAAIHRQRAAKPEDKALVKAEAAIIAEHGVEILGPKLAKLYPQGLNWSLWRHGFLDAVSITFAKKKKTSPYDVLTAVLESPASVFLRRLELAHVPGAQHAKVVETVLAAKARPPLRDIGLDDTLPDELLEAFPRLQGKRYGEEIQTVAASDGPLSNLEFSKYKNLAEWGAACVAHVVSSRPAREDFALPIIEPAKLGGRPNRAAVALAIERVVAGELGIRYSEPRQRAAANHLVYWLDEMGEPVSKALRRVAVGVKKR